MSQSLFPALSLSLLLSGAGTGVAQEALSGTTDQVPRITSTTSIVPQSRSERAAGRVRMMGAELFVQPLAADKCLSASATCRQASTN